MTNDRREQREKEITSRCLTSSSSCSGFLTHFSSLSSKKSSPPSIRLSSTSSSASLSSSLSQIDEYVVED
ncbi:unnamed protein product [Ilex paraguariensis]|uniref:Uncharacterized protein n=1 Tax=Ilex paraguariensis TaxID=185542 RepID=A0ABC8U5J4_9AQUA